ncbi:MAG TPA: ankyrin repeat domain-containing protein [Steroidobacteraceae bacterium]|nr:ankyrin repeat domain-containing protein [Steroidobacteraceae bacterium]
MTSKESAQDKELLERYRRASDTEAAAPSEAVRAAILAEGRRVAEQRAKETRGQPFDAFRPAANDSRWKITAFGTAGAALVAVLLFAPRLWESASPPARSAGGAIVAESADKAAAPSEAGAAQPPKLDSLRTSPSAEPLQEIVVTQAKRENSKAARAAPERQRAEEKTYVQNHAPAAPLADAAAPAAPAATPAAPAATPAAPAPEIAPRVTSLNAARVADSKNTLQPTALLSAAASGDTVQTTALLNQGAALEARDEAGRTPLMLAVMQRKPEVVRLLLDRGADPNVADRAGRTPLQQAKQENLREIAALLERAGAR